MNDQIPISPSAPQEVPGLLDQISSHGDAFLNADPDARLKLLEDARALVNALETPRESMIRYCWAQSTIYAAIETGVDIDLFHKLSRNDRPKSAAELAEDTECDPVMLSRLLKHLAAMGVIGEAGPDLYCRTGFTIALCSEKYSDGFPLMTRRFTAGIHALPAYLKKNGYRNPTKPTDTALQLGFNTDLHFFEIAKQDPVTARQFNNHMSVYSVGRPSWMDVGFFPVQERLIEDSNITNDDALLVDMGGSIGHDLSEFKRKWPDAPGRLILQDLPTVVCHAQGLDPAIQVTPHDFFTPQPVKDARAYYMHSVLHDWPDDMCRKILANLTPALRSGYSKVLINENVIPDKGAYWETTSLDLIMMAIGSGERTERHWHKLLESAGLKIMNIWTAPAQKGVESLIECELA
ncbi:uncharacterized protein ASPGLDRAFT_70426 [Aspergillus glaucus CBS 516.65]|uniref:Uncharacterized protein n=1 Tax=Aspergillus glaucus CBS 516.65 TaxID=1160497 RepID=A0A1L9V4T3_ASPGL|nr:hypothetical protein ASPGLDRAFT_70426 [Aspergillus glaucus CBS 516.65]OJJ78945.1 hypothetical protein ASPGLDRAFT_70426 [Aspergillus glaucus CBS 516.65]